MTQFCKVCASPKRLSVDREIVQGNSMTIIAKKYDLPYASVYHHSKNHISRQIATIYDQRASQHNFDLMQKIETIIGNAETIFKRNFDNKKDVVALKAIDSVRSTIELLAKIQAMYYESKLMQLEIDKQESGQGEAEIAEQFQKSLSVLTMEELKVLEKLQLKIKKQDSTINCLPAIRRSNLGAKDSPTVDIYEAELQAETAGKQPTNEDSPLPNYQTVRRKRTKHIPLSPYKRTMRID